MKNKIVFIILCSLNFAYLSLAQTATISGKVTKINAEPIPGTLVTLTGNNFTNTTTTGEDGGYTFSEVPTGVTYTLSMDRDGLNALNGLSTFDLVLILKHIIRTPMLSTTFHEVAADINEDGRISILDTYELRQLILGIDTPRPNLMNWRFFAADYDYELDPFNVPYTLSINLTESKENIDFLGVKLGDVNSSATGL